MVNICFYVCKKNERFSTGIKLFLKQVVLGLWQAAIQRLLHKKLILSSLPVGKAQKHRRKRIETV
jgi:hypothetical protein